MGLCPVKDKDCPYLLENGVCDLAEPETDCDEYHEWFNEQE